MAKTAYIGDQTGVAAEVTDIYVGDEREYTTDTHTVLMLHGESFSDESGKNTNIINQGGAISSDKSKFGGSSIYFNGSSYMKIPYKDMPKFSNKDFTIDGWFCFSAFRQYRRLFSHQYCEGCSYGGFHVELNGNADGFWVYAGKDGSVSDAKIQATYAMTTGQWYHIALVRRGSNLTLYVDGVSIGSADIGTDVIHQSENASFKIGSGTNESAADDAANNFFEGYIDEFRISDVARWTGNFTPPTAAYEKVKISVAEEVLWGYVGVNGIARLFWAAGPSELAYYGNVADLLAAAYSHAAASVGDYALFAGGSDNSGNTMATVTAYDKSLTRIAATDLGRARSELSGASAERHAMFAGGYMKSSGYTGRVDAYDESLTWVYPDELSSARTKTATAYVGGYALFAGGGGSGSYSVVNAYGPSLERITIDPLPAAGSASGANTKKHAMFTGCGNRQKHAVSYDASLTKVVMESMSVGRSRHGAAAAGKHVLFAGGSVGTYDTDVGDIVEAYDESLTRSIIAPLGVARDDMGSASLGEYALFSGGAESRFGVLDAADAYDASLTRVEIAALGYAGAYVAAAAVGDYAIFAGGNDSSEKRIAKACAYALV